MMVFRNRLIWCITDLVIISVISFELPKSCKIGQYYEPSSLICTPCPVNASMVTASDGFGCTCNDHSISVGPSKCKQCGATNVVSMDGSTCVPRRCQNTTRGIVCRKCPNDYISVTQNVDGSPTKEVLCVKCSRGYKAENNRCVRCEYCICSKSEVVVRGKCIPKRYVTERPKDGDTQLHPNTLLDIVKHEYLCTQKDIRSCRILADECVRSSYLTDLAGPCRLWIQNNSLHLKDIPQLSFNYNSNDKQQCEIELKHSQKTILITLAAYTKNGGVELLQDPDKSSCLPPLTVSIGNDYSCDYHMNVSKLPPYKTLSPYIQMNEDWLPIPVSIRKSNGYYLQKGAWPTDRFKRYFLLHNFQSTTVNITNTVYLSTLIIRISIQRDQSKTKSITASVSMEAHYADKSPLSSSITISLRVEHELPMAGIAKGLEIWGGVLGVLSVLYGVVQWRGALRRGSIHYSIIPILAGCGADALYFAAWFSTLHAIAIEVGTSGLILAPSYSEEYLIRACLFSAVSLKVLKVVFLNWKQIRCDIFFLDWTKYNSAMKEKTLCDFSDFWKTATVAREWSSMQAKRRASPSYTVPITITLLKLTINHWDANVADSSSYQWAITTLVWWISYSLVLLSRWTIDRLFGTSSENLTKICSSVDVSLLVFQEELYAHYVHGRYDDSSDAQTMSGPLATCRIVCTPQLRTIYNQLTTLGPDNVGLGDGEAKRTLLSRFLAAFFERALDGVSWVASERTVLERLLNVELLVRESGNTSTLLYDSNDSTPSCLALTWWGEEWTLATFDAMLFGCIVLATTEYLTAALVVILVWQAMKHLRIWFGNENIKQKTGIEEMY